MNETEAKTVEEQAKLDEVLRQQTLTLESINSLKLEKERIESEIASSQKHLDEVLEKSNVASETLWDAEDRIKGLGDKESEAQKSFARIVFDAREKEKSTKEAQRLAENLLESTKNEQKRVMESIATTVSVHTKAMEMLNKEKYALSDIVETLKKDKDALHREIETLEKKKSVLEEHVTGMDHALVDIETKVKNAQESLVEIERYISSKQEESSLMEANLAEFATLKAQAQKELDAIKKDVEKNNLTNNDFLKTRSEMMALSLELEQRREFLVNKYGDIGETW